MSTIATDHLFRHQFGKMVSILTRIFGLENMELIEDAVQDTFISAIKSWQNKLPDNPEAWLTTAAKNRVIDLFRKIKSDKNRFDHIYSGAASIQISEMFSEYEIEDSQLRMIFTACHPLLNAKEQIAFALRSISGFSAKEIATALLSTEESIKKRLQRARKTIKTQNVAFEIPTGRQLIKRRDRVLEVIYLIFNEGFHSGLKDKLVRKDLCGEALRLIKLLLKKESLRHPKVYALFALLCFHSSRLESKMSASDDVIDLKHQDRSLWYFPLMAIGNEAMNKALEEAVVLSSYHYEAAIAAEHLRAPDYASTNWELILEYYQKLDALQSSPHSLLNLAIVYIELHHLEKAYKLLKPLSVKDFAGRAYLLYGSWAEYHFKKQDLTQAIQFLDSAILEVSNQAEKKYLMVKKEKWASQL